MKKEKCHMVSARRFDVLFEWTLAKEKDENWAKNWNLLFHMPREQKPQQKSSKEWERKLKKGFWRILVHPVLLHSQPDVFWFRAGHQFKQHILWQPYKKARPFYHFCTIFFNALAFWNCCHLMNTKRIATRASMQKMVTEKPRLPTGTTNSWPWNAQ